MVQPRSCQMRTRCQKSAAGAPTLNLGSRFSGITARIGLICLARRIASISDQTSQFIAGQRSSKRRRYFARLGLCMEMILEELFRTLRAGFGFVQQGGHTEHQEALERQDLLALVFTDDLPS